jgi:S1-C subfamily serine protease
VKKALASADIGRDITGERRSRKVENVSYDGAMIRHALAVLLLAGPAAAASDDEALRRATVQIFVVSRSPDYAQPWQFGRQGSSTGSGVVIEGRRILTNGHVVANAAYLSVRKVGEVKRWAAKVEFVGHDGETALISVEDPAFFAGTVAAKLGGVPSQRDKVAVYGFPIGGTDMSVTEGIVSRVGVTNYAHSARSLLAVQTDAAINPGNSGGPVFQEGRLVGIAFQHASGGQNIGYAVPVPLIKRFLKDAEDGRYDGIPELGAWWQGTENDGLRRALGLPDDATGALITKIGYGSSAWGVLREGDALVSLDGVAISQDGTIPFRDSERVDFSDLISRRQVGETLKAVVVREGKRVELALTLKPALDLVPGPRHDEKPAYLIACGLVFMPLSDNLIATRGGSFRVRSLSADGMRTPERTEAVVLSHVLADELNRGHHQWSMAVLTRANGRAIGAFADLVAAVKSPAGGRHEFEFDHYSGFGENRGARIVLDADACARAQPAILKRYGVTSERSEGLGG